MQQILSYLKDLENNNNREWFKANKTRYTEVQERFEEYIMLLIAKVQEIDPGVKVNSPKECTFRIYRDIRFSKNKLPYKDHMGAHISDGGRKSPKAGYYLHISPDNCFAGGGVYHPQPKILKAIRNEIFENPEEFKAIINEPKFKETFDGIYGERLKTAPRGFPKIWPDIELLRPKSYALIHPLSEKEITNPNLFNILEDIFRTQYNFNQYMNRIIKNIK
ncbi:MAG: DUF2461 domain-containing protein [Bacteroidota bacterium]|nr:DUF2461 domain-containing protein [Bacteroidota bacterium]